MPGHNMDTELDDIMDQFLEMERELSGMPTTGETDTVKLRKKVPTTVSVFFIGLDIMFIVHAWKGRVLCILWFANCYTSLLIN